MARHESRRNGDFVKALIPKKCASWSERRIRLLAAGICGHCGKRPSAEDCKYCVKCLDYWQSYRDRRGAETGTNRDGATFDEIGAAMGFSRQRAEQVFKFALLKLQVALDDFGIDTNGMSVESFVKIALARRSDWRMAHWSEFLATAIERNAAKAAA